MKNAFCPRPLSHGSAALTLVISTGAQRSGETCGFFFGSHAASKVELVSKQDFSAARNGSSLRAEL
jgi:hypothetical protein